MSGAITVLSVVGRPAPGTSASRTARLPCFGKRDDGVRWAHGGACGCAGVRDSWPGAGRVR